MKNTKRLNVGIDFIEYNGQKLLVPTYAEVVCSYNKIDNVSSWSVYVAYYIMLKALYAVKQVLDFKLSKTGNTFFYDLWEDAYLRFQEFCLYHIQDLCSIIQDLRNTRAIINKMLSKCSSTELIFQRNKITDTIERLEKLWITGRAKTGNGDGYDLVAECNYIFIKALKEKNLLWDDKDDNDKTVYKNGQKRVNKIINDLKHNFEQIENNTETENDNGVKITAIEQVADKSFFEDVDDYDTFFRLHNIVDDKQKDILTKRANGWSVADIATNLHISKPYVYKILTKIKEDVE